MIYQNEPGNLFYKDLFEKKLKILLVKKISTDFCQKLSIFDQFLRKSIDIF